MVFYSCIYQLGGSNELTTIETKEDWEAFLKDSDYFFARLSKEELELKLIEEGLKNLSYEEVLKKIKTDRVWIDDSVEKYTLRCQRSVF